MLASMSWSVPWIAGEHANSANRQRMSKAVLVVRMAKVLLNVALVIGGMAGGKSRKPPKRISLGYQ
jgi:hypothetical protein